jgi:predicted nucleotidyltransferase
MDRAASAQQIEKLKQQLLEKYQPEKIVVFGSAAWGSGEADDVDILIVKEDVPRLGTDRISELYRIINADVAVDYLVYKPAEIEERVKLGDPFIKKIMEEGKVLYG